jgi:hypothetical protein
VLRKKRWYRSLFGLLGSLAAAACSSSSNLSPLDLRVKTVEDTVVLQVTPGGSYFKVTAIVLNADTRTLDVETCLTPAQREIDGVWTTIFAPNCFSSAIVPLGGGDSVVVPVQAIGFTKPNTFPHLDPRMVPGRYRLLFGVGLGNSAPPTGSSRTEVIPSAPFIVR